MAAIVYQKDNRSGITYAYESVSHWDKEKKQSRSKRTLIGRVDPVTGDILPTDGRRRKSASSASDKEHTSESTNIAQRRFYGATYLFDEIGKKIGLTEDLKICFPDTYSQILSIAYYLILEDSNALFRFEKWHTLHKHPFNKDIPSQRSSELFASITEDSINTLFRLQAKRRVEQEYWAYDITSISSYSEQLRHVQYGVNKEDDRLPQINIAMVFGEESNLPFYYRRLPGNIPDSKTVKNLLADLNLFGLSRVKLVMDRGFYSEDNVNDLFADNINFLMAAKMSLKFIKNSLEPSYSQFRSLENYSDKYDLYAKTVPVFWDNSAKGEQQRDVPKDKKLVYIHYYFNIDKAAEDEKALDKKLFMLRSELESGKRLLEHEAMYCKYFEEYSDSQKGAKIIVRESVVRQIKKHYGFFALISNEKMDADTALEIYRNKDVVEKGFGNLKERLNMRRALVSSEQSMNGKLFVEFIALIFLSYIKKQMQLKNLFKEYTLQGLLDKLDIIECYEFPGKNLRVSELLEKQKLLYREMDINPPTSL